MSLAVRLVVVAVVFSGCSGLAAEEETTPAETLTPAPVPDTDRRSTVDGRVAPGLTDERLVDERALLSAHSRRLSDSSHTYRERVIRRYGNGTVQRRGTSVVRRDGPVVAYEFVGVERNGPSTAVERWSNGSVTYTRERGANGSSYEVARRGDIGLETADYTGSLTRLFSLVTVTVNGTATRDGREVYRVETPEPQAVPPLQNVSFVGYVTPEGVVTDYRVSYVAGRGSAPVEVSVRVSVSELGSTAVDQPEWYGAAVNATG